ncbi:phosphomethylpyrimidine synthase ThiC, partial [Propionibacterium freudenreichii]|nr:phosphomethylpyrimidine synthase ThiC [Propionibacterium freudenreichii]
MDSSTPNNAPANRVRATRAVKFGDFTLEVPYQEIKLQDTPGGGANAPFTDYCTQGPDCDSTQGLPPMRQPWIDARGDTTVYSGRGRNLADDGRRAAKRGASSREWQGRTQTPLRS